MSAKDAFDGGSPVVYDKTDPPFSAEGDIQAQDTDIATRVVVVATRQSIDQVLIVQENTVIRFSSIWAKKTEIVGNREELARLMLNIHLALQTQ